MTISHPDMVKKLFKDPSTFTIPNSELNLLHAAVGLAGEVGEVAMAAHAPYSDTWQRKVTDEMGDVEFYAEALVQALGIERNDYSLRLAANSYEAARSHSVRMMHQALTVLDIVKKVAFNNRQNLDDKLRNETHSMLLLVQAMYRPLGISRQMALDANIAKLGARYKGFNYSDEAAAARRDES